MHTWNYFSKAAKRWGKCLERGKLLKSVSQEAGIRESLLPFTCVEASATDNACRACRLRERVFSWDRPWEIEAKKLERAEATNRAWTEIRGCSRQPGKGPAVSVADVALGQQHPSPSLLLCLGEGHQLHPGSRIRREAGYMACQRVALSTPCSRYEPGVKGVQGQLTDPAIPSLKKARGSGSSAPSSSFSYGEDVSITTQIPHTEGAGTAELSDSPPDDEPTPASTTGGAEEPKQKIAKVLQRYGQSFCEEIGVSVKGGGGAEIAVDLGESVAWLLLRLSRGRRRWGTPRRAPGPGPQVTCRQWCCPGTRPGIDARGAHRDPPQIDMAGGGRDALWQWLCASILSSARIKSKAGESGNAHAALPSSGKAGGRCAWP